MNITLLIFSLVAGLIFMLQAHAQTLSDVEKEKRWAEQVVDTLFDGEAVWLSAGDHTFLALEMVADDNVAQRGIVILHGIGAHPNWEQIIRPLRVELAGNGWDTLSIQMPILANDAAQQEYTPLFDEVPNRIDAALEHLRARGISKVILVAHSMGAAMAVSYLAGHHNNEISGAVLIGLNANLSPQLIDIESALRNTSIPIFDIYGADDLPGVIASASGRAIALQIAGQSSSQIMVADANHFFEGKEDQLLDLINQWFLSVGSGQ